MGGPPDGGEESAGSVPAGGRAERGDGVAGRSPVEGGRDDEGAGSVPAGGRAERGDGTAGRSPAKARAERVDTLVVEEGGRWAVDIVVLFGDSVVRRRIAVYPTRRRAEISARLIRRGAEREVEGPLNG